MAKSPKLLFPLALFCISAATASLNAQIGTRFESERRVVQDPVTGNDLIFVTSKPAGDSKIYQTQPQWTSDGEWMVFRSRRVPGEAIAVHEDSGVMVQATEGGYIGMLNIARKSMHLYLIRDPNAVPDQRPETPRGDLQLVRVDLGKLFADSESGKLAGADAYQKVVGIIPAEMDAGGDMTIDADEAIAYFRVGRGYAERFLPEGVVPEENFGPRNMGKGPTGIAKMDLTNGKIDYVASVPFQAGHIQANPWVSGEIFFCWETGGKAPTRVWTIKGDGTGLRPVYKEPSHDWVTHEAVISPDEIAVAILGHRPIGFKDDWGVCGSREFATGLGIINVRTGHMRIEGQTKKGSGLWHVHGSPDGRFAVGDDFSRSIWLVDRRNGEMMLLSTGHKPSAADHPHPTFSPCGTKIQIQSAMLSEDDKTMNIVVIPVPESWLKRDFPVYDLPEGNY